MKDSKQSFMGIGLLIIIVLGGMVFFDMWSGEDKASPKIAKKFSKSSQGRAEQRINSSGGNTSERTSDKASKRRSMGGAIDTSQEENSSKRKRLLEGGAVAGQASIQSHWAKSEDQFGDDDPHSEDSSKHVSVSREYSPEMLSRELEYILEIEDSSERRESLAELGKLMSGENLDLAHEFLGQLEDKGDRQIFANGVVTSLLKNEDPAGAAQWIAETPVDLQRGVVGKIAGYWARIDIDQAVGWAEQLSEQNLKTQAVGNIATVWASKDMQATYNWAARNEDPSLSSLIFTRMGVVLAKQDPQAAANWAMEFEDEKTRANILVPAVRLWTSKDVSSTIAWAEELPEGNLKSRVARDITTIWSRREQAPAANWAASLPDVGSRTSAVASAMHQWASKDPVAAFQWAKDLSDEDSVKNLAFYSIAKVWAWQNPQKAIEVTNTLNNEILRNQMIDIIEKSKKIKQK